MGFKSLFPFFNRDEVAPSEPDENPDVESKFGRVLARLMGASNSLSVFKFLRSDYNGRLHITETPTDFDNLDFGTTLAIVGTVQIVPTNPDRQVILLANHGTATADLEFVIGSDVIFDFGILPGDMIELRGFTQKLQMTATALGADLHWFEA